MFGVTALPSLLFLLGMLVVPESPRWLARNGRREKAGRILHRLNGEAHAKQALAEIESILADQRKGQLVGPTGSQTRPCSHPWRFVGRISAHGSACGTPPRHS